MPHLNRACTFLVAAFVAVVVAGQAEATAGGTAAGGLVEYLYIDASEGGSSGGHAAIRLGDDVYHFQHHRPGVLRLHREEWPTFLYRYGELENRTIHASRIAAAGDTATLLRDRFAQQYLIQGKQFDALDDARSDRDLLETLLTQPTPAIAFRGIGYFFGDETAPAAAAINDAVGNQPVGDSPLAKLRARILRTYGPDFIGTRHDAIARQVAELKPDDTETATPDIAADRYPRSTPGFARSYHDLMIGWFALHALDAGLPLRAGTYRAPAGDEFRLTAEELDVLHAAAAQLEEQLIRLVASQRPDWGFVFCLGMARLLALDQTLQMGRLVFLDAFPADADVIDHATVESRGDIMPAVLAEARAQLARARARLRARQPPDESAINDVEDSANRVLEIRAAVFEGQSLRAYAGRLVPVRGALRSDIITPTLNPADLKRSLALARGRERAYAKSLQGLYAYNVVTNNCVSAIFREINAALADSMQSPSEQRDVQTASRERLGGYLGPGQPLAFIPFVSAQVVDDTYTVTRTERIRSYRTVRLAEMYRRENALAVYLRESNVITSTVYRHRPQDSTFLFFTDDAVAPRPLFGALNLAVGLGASAAGLVLVPFDGGRLLLGGLRGALFSMPELAFFNIRKGSFDYVADRAAPSILSAGPLPVGSLGTGANETVTQAQPEFQTSVGVVQFGRE